MPRKTFEQNARATLILTVLYVVAGVIFTATANSWGQRWLGVAWLVLAALSLVIFVFRLRRYRRRNDGTSYVASLRQLLARRGAQ
jgi:drug/metabolite transporter (DMT)-like permease